MPSKITVNGESFNGPNGEITATRMTLSWLHAHAVEVFLGAFCTVLIALAALYLAGVLKARVPATRMWRTTAAYAAAPLLATVGLALAATTPWASALLLPIYVEVAVVVLLTRVLACGIALLFKPAVLLDHALRFVSLVTGVVVAIQSLQPPRELMQPISALELNIGASKISAEGLLNGATFGVIVFIVALSISKAAEKSLLRSQSLPHNLLLALANISRTVIWCVAIGLTLIAIGIDVTTMAAFGGALGIGLGLGLKRLASSYVSGLIILFEQSIRIGDTISTGAIKGRVTRLNARYTMIRSSDGAEAVIPNDVLTSTSIVNETWSDRQVRLEASVLIQPDGDVASAKACIYDALVAQQRILPEPAPCVYVAAIERGGIRLEAHFWIGDPDNGKLNVISDVNDFILDRLRQKGIALSHGVDAMCLRSSSSISRPCH
ncbi:mechanosensitive ion channel [Cupriavidus basilensis]|uniref:Mechanosensitive ion channel n=1 Tax=Cupriavidus basilensis TaxID=68895 RepID=A0ABT6B357_9BURK|nr:mechanosensitive ion channel domain-containing protein [Cupriavidus basilensis]MDF3839238.1 mechanosensitive ion channel [Cupriavidus basilensis]